MSNDADMEVIGLASGLQSGETGALYHSACECDYIGCIWIRRDWLL